MNSLFSRIGQFFANTFRPYILYSAHIFKFWVNEITMSALGLLTCFAVYLTDGIPLLQVLLAIFAPAFFCYLLYDSMFTFGNRDSVSIEYHKMEFDKIFGLRIFAFAFAPSIFFILLTAFLSLAGVADAPAVTASVYYLLNAYNLGFFWILSGVISQPYIIMCIMAVPTAFFCFLGYYLGARDLPIRKLLGIPMRGNTKKKSDGKDASKRK